ncbi:MAG: hypothetical protein KAI47_12930 [Deltaproteobacteria bacterium]|nr:hypothetical protein [Deltaproteobacteria bacterium]
MGLKAKLENLKHSAARMSPRERVMVGALGSTIIVLIIFGVSYAVFSKVEDLREHNQAMRNALSDIAKYKTRFLEAKRREASLKIAIPDTTLELNSYVDKAASAIGVKIDETSEVRPAEGSRFRQRGLLIKLRKLTLGQLAALLKELESSATYLVQVTEMTVYTRFRKHEAVDAELVVSTYEKMEAKKKKGKKGHERGGRRS